MNDGGGGGGTKEPLARKPHDFEKLRLPTNAASDWRGAGSVDYLAFETSIKPGMLCFRGVYLLSRVEGRGFHVEGEGTMSRVEGNIFFFQLFFLEMVIIDAINVIKTNKKNVKNKWRGNIF